MGGASNRVTDSRGQERGGGEDQKQGHKGGAGLVKGDRSKE